MKLCCKLILLLCAISCCLPGFIDGIKTRDVPKADDDGPMNVNVTLMILDLSSFRLVDMEYRIDFYIIYEWNINANFCKSYERKLKFASNVGALAPGDTIAIPSEEHRLFWYPDAYIVDAKTLSIPSITGKKMLTTLSVNHDGSCLMKHEARVAAIVACKMNFKDYPYDMQVCSFRFRNHFYPMDLVTYQWSEHGAYLEKPILLNNYELNHNFSKYNAKTVVNETYSWLRVDFRLERKLSHFLVQVMLPTLIIIIVAYSSFWVPVDSGTSRFQLTVVTLLSLVTQFVGVKNNLPPVSYVIAVDIWMFICMLFIFSAILEVSTVNFLSFRTKKLLEKRKREEEERLKFFRSLPQFKDYTVEDTRFVLETLLMQNPDVDAPRFPRSGTVPFIMDPAGGAYLRDLLTRQMAEARGVHWPLEPLKPIPNLALRVDKTFRIVYPIAFLIFNAVFWPLLLNRKLL